MKQESAKKKNPIVFIELLRIAACFFVIVNHSTTAMFLNRQPSFTWFASLTYFFCSKIAVPIFIMISGYLMLDKKADYQKTGKAILRIVLVLIVFSSLYYFTEPGEKNIPDFFQTIYSSNITNAFWYLYLYLGILVMMPFLQNMVQNFEKKDFYIFFALSAVVNMIFPILLHYRPNWRYYGWFNLPLMDSWICMLLIGLYWKRYSFSVRNTRIWCITIFLFSTFANVMLTYFEYGRNDGLDYLFLDDRSGNIFIVLSAAAAFGFFSTLHLSGKVAKGISYVGGLTFGIYLLGDFILVRQDVNTTLLSVGVHPLISIVITELFIFAVGGIITAVLKKVPYLKQLL